MKQTLLKSWLMLVMLLVGVGTTWAADTYVQLTSIEGIDESAEYVLGIDGTGFHKSGTSSWGVCTNSGGGTPLKYKLVKATDGNSFKAYTTIGSTTYYLTVPTSNTFTMATSSTAGNTDMIIGTTQVSSTNYAVTNKGTTTRHLRLNGTSGLRSYAGTTGTMAYFYKVVASGPSVLSISIKTAPTKTTYMEGEKFDPAGLVITKTLSNDTKEDVTYDNDTKNDFTFDPDLTKELTNETSVTIKYGNKTASQTITVNPFVAAEGTYTISTNTALYSVSAGNNGTEQSVEKYGITVVSGCKSSATSKTYYDTNHIRYYTDSYLKLTAPTGFEITKVVFTSDGTWNSGPKCGTNGSYNNTTKTWEGKTSQLDLTFSDQNRIRSIAVTYATASAPEPTKTLVSIAASGTAADLWTKDEFSHNGITITATYDDESTTDVTSSCSFTGYDMTTAGTQTITATYKEQTCTYSVDVKTIANTEETAYTVAEAIALVDAGKGLKENVYVKGEVSSIQSTSVSSAGKINFFIDSDAFEFYGCLNIGGAKFTSLEQVLVGANVVGKGLLTKYNTTYEFATGCELVSYQAPAGGKETATISVSEAKTALMVGDYDEYEVSYNGDGVLVATSSNENVAEVIIDGNQVLVSAVGKGTTTITISAPATENYFAAEYKYTLSVSQLASLPFSFNGGRSNITTTDGMSYDGLGTDYSSSPKLKFDSSNDVVIINYTGEAGVLQYTIKGNTYKGGTFDVLESANGTDYTTIKSYTALPSSYNESYPLSADTRFVKFVYTNKSEGNVALGAIKIFAGYVRNVEKDSYGTICLPYAVETPAGATFSSVSSIDKTTGVLTLSNETSLEAGKPYIFQATGTVVVCQYTGEAVAEPVADEYLTGVFEATPAPEGAYVMQSQEGVVGFYKVGSVIPTVGANRAYLNVPDANVRAFYFSSDDVATAIEGVNAETTKADVIYNMAGQRVNKAQKGIYIINGKKVLK